MAANDRNNPLRQASSDSDYSLIEFMREYPDDAACLDRLWREQYAPDGHHAHCPKCDRERKFHRTKTRASYTCDTCGLHVHPMKGTIFEKSTTSLQLWFYAMYLMTSTRCGISAKQLERELGVTYKTAHRMMKRIRTELMTDEGDEPLSGDVEVDETSWGGKPRNKLPDRRAVAAFREAKPTVLGMVERDGRVRARVITSRRGPALSREVRANVLPTSILFTDDWQAYKPLRREYLDHRVINHSAGLYVDGSTHTNTIEGFFGNLKTGMRGAYKKVSPRYLQSYLNEYAWRLQPPPSPHRTSDVRVVAAARRTLVDLKLLPSNFRPYGHLTDRLAVLVDLLNPDLVRQLGVLFKDRAQPGEGRIERSFLGDHVAVLYVKDAEGHVSLLSSFAPSPLPVNGDVSRNFRFRKQDIRLSPDRVVANAEGLREVDPTTCLQMNGRHCERVSAGAVQGLIRVLVHRQAAVSDVGQVFRTRAPALTMALKVA